MDHIRYEHTRPLGKIIRTLQASAHLLVIGEVGTPQQPVVQQITEAIKQMRRCSDLVTVKDTMSSFGIDRAGQNKHAVADCADQLALLPEPEHFILQYQAFQVLTHAGGMTAE